MFPKHVVLFLVESLAYSSLCQVTSLDARSGGTEKMDKQASVALLAFNFLQNLRELWPLQDYFFGGHSWSVCRLATHKQSVDDWKTRLCAFSYWAAGEDGGREGSDQKEALGSQILR